MFKCLLFGLMIVGFFQIGRGQLSDTLKAVSVYSEKDSIIKISVPNASVPYYLLNDYVLQNMGVVDIGEALKFIPGANIKDYGGIGGLKTINYRSLGTAHTGIEQDGITIPDQQTGTINLGSYTAFGIESLEMSSGQVQHKNAFATAHLKANMLSLFNTISTPAKSKTLIKTHSEWLSVNAIQNGILVKQKIGKRFTIGGQGVYRFGSGVYNYQVKNGQNIIDADRAPTDLKQLQLLGVLQYNYNKLNIIIEGSKNSSDQNLPGAVVFYDPNNKETLTKTSTQGSVKATYLLKKQSLSAHLFTQNSNTRYFQDFVLNSQGFIENSYQQKHSGTGIVYHFFIGSPTQSIFIGTDIIHSNFEGSQYEKTPIRTAMNSVLGLTKWLGKFKIQGNLSHQQIIDESIEEETTFRHFSPFLSLSYIPFKEKSFRIRTFYKNTFRMPSFNDLYYRAIGNLNLLPEKADLFNLGITFSKGIGTINLESTIDVFHNIVENKIVAIPTKNLFNWSMQNIGRTQGQGIELSLLFKKKFDKSNVTFSTNQSVNKSIDVTAINGFTYGQQLPYTPLYFGSYHLNYQHKYFISSVNILHSGSRYVLNENITTNYLDGYFDLGFNIAHQFKVKEDYAITFKIQANNILDNNYQIIRSFPMPGRHYMVTLQYQLKR